MLIVIASISMLLFIISKNRYLGLVAWIFTGLAFLERVPNFLSIQDYFNTAVFTLAFVLFALFGYVALKGDLDVMLQVTRFSLLSILFYFPFELYTPLRRLLIETVANQTFALGRFLGFEFVRLSWDEIVLNDRGVRIILPCTGIESMSLYAGACFGVKADVRRKIEAFLVSVPTIYVLNLFRNVFVLASYGYMWFGENSFYVAHHVIAKFLALVSLVVITLVVFKILPELENLIVSLKMEIEKVIR